jgi:hypothetical protein
LKENVVVGKNSKKLIKNFIENYKKYKMPKVTLKTSPAKIVVDTLLKDK